MPKVHFSYDSAIICKGCRQLHSLNQLPSTSYVVFPKGDFSTIRVFCENKEKWYDYEHEELMRWVKQEDEVAEKLIESERRLTEIIMKIEERLTELEKNVGKRDSEETLAQRVKTVEGLVTQLAERFLSTKQKEPPEGLTV